MAKRERSVDQAENSKTCLRKWEEFLNKLKMPLEELLVRTARYSATNPYKIIVCVILLSFSLAVVGLFTNFSIETNNNILWSPSKSITFTQNEWAANPELSGFPVPGRKQLAIMHSNGKDILSVEGMKYAFEAMDVVLNSEGYKELCIEEIEGNYVQKCEIMSPTGFWKNHNKTLFEEMIQSEEDMKKALSQFRFSNGDVVNRALIIGNTEPELSTNDIQLFIIKNSLGDLGSQAFDLEFQNELLARAAEEFELESAQSFLFTWDLPSTGPEGKLSRELELLLTEEFNLLDERWKEGGSDFSIRFTSRRAGGDELIRGIFKDIPILALAFLMMTLFTMYSLSKCDRIESQTSLGIGAIASIFFAILTGYGLLFIIGIPLTSLTYLFPYAMLGLGLDGMFIIMGSFERTDPNESVADRIEATIREIGMSVAVSTLTTVVAYFLGSSSSMPGIRWFCFYASPTIIISFIYQMTFFIAIVSLDDKRQEAKRLDFLICCKSTQTASRNETPNEEEKLTCGQKLISGYASFLLNRFTKVFVLILFAGMLGLGSWYASGIESALDVRLLFPEDSYILEFFQGIDDYGGGGAVNFQYAQVYFRDVDVSDPVVQDQMIQYVNDLVSIPYISQPPLTFWLRDFNLWKSGNEYVQQLDFNSQVDFFLSLEEYKSLYKRDIARDEDGTIISSRTLLNYDRVDPYDVNEQTDAFQAQRQVAIDQSINEGSADGKFFTTSFMYYGWELWNTLPREVIQTIILGLASVFIICLIFISHPIGTIILTPTVAATFIEILAVLRFAGLYMNAITAIGLITCVGLVVDYAIHICLAYFEVQDAKDRNERVHKVITTMGVSILKGGFTTFLGVLLLARNSSLTFRTIFVTFVGITTLGVSHGLIFLPVVLAYIGPMEKKEKVESFDNNNDATERSISEQRIKVSSDSQEQHTNEL